MIFDKGVLFLQKHDLEHMEDYDNLDEGIENEILILGGLEKEQIYDIEFNAKDLPEHANTLATIIDYFSIAIKIKSIFDVEEAINLIRNNKQDYEELLVTNTNKGADERIKSIIEGYSIALRALEKQTPQKPYQLTVSADTKIGILNFRKGTKIYNCYDCSECVRYKDLYCSHCGQKLAWD